MKNKIKLFQIRCKKCGKPITTTNRSIYGAEDLKAKYGELCCDCVSVEEKARINYDLGIFLTTNLLSGKL